MPLKGEVRNKYMREYMRRRRAANRTGTPRQADRGHGGPAQELAKAKAAGEAAAAEIAALKAALARERKQREAAEARHSEPGGNDDDAATDGPMGKKVFKLVIQLDSDNDNVVLVAARKLVSELKSNGSDLRVLSNALEAEWEKQQKAKEPPPLSIDWAAVTVAVNNYAADRTTVNLNRVWAYAKVKVPALDKYRGGDAIARHIFGCLERLGFTGSSSRRTWQRKAG